MMHNIGSRINVGFGYMYVIGQIYLLGIVKSSRTGTHGRGHSSPSQSTTKMLTRIRNFICCVHKYQSLTALSWESDSSLKGLRKQVKFTYELEELATYTHQRFVSVISQDPSPTAFMLSSFRVSTLIRGIL